MGVLRAYWTLKHINAPIFIALAIKLLFINELKIKTLTLMFYVERWKKKRTVLSIEVNSSILRIYFIITHQKHILKSLSFESHKFSIHLDFNHVYSFTNDILLLCFVYVIWLLSWQKSKYHRNIFRQTSGLAPDL